MEHGETVYGEPRDQTDYGTYNKPSEGEQDILTLAAAALTSSQSSRTQGHANPIECRMEGRIDSPYSKHEAQASHEVKPEMRFNFANNQQTVQQTMQQTNAEEPISFEQRMKEYAATYK